jgi:tetratricopeptide (TPR) repeat protein
MHPCPQCARTANFSPKRQRYFCAECEIAFDAAVQSIDPQTVFLSYAHKSEREGDFDVSEDLVWLVKQALEGDGHRVWIDSDGIRGGHDWRERITAAILGHEHFLTFLSRRSVRDPGVCLNEIAIALGHRRSIQTVLTEVESDVSPPLTISHIQWHDLRDWREIRAGSKTGPNGQNWEGWLAQRLAPIREAIADAQNARVSGQLQRLRAILQPRSFEGRIVEKTDGFFGRQWLFDACQDWLDQGSSRLFWLKGSPGIGKSAFAASLVHRRNSAVIGFFMCDFQGRQDPEDSAREAICTLAFQMASRLPDYRLKLLHQQQVDREKVEKKSADDLFEYLISEPLNRAGKIPEATRLMLVIDGLDEAGRNDGRNALAALLQKHAWSLPPWLGIVITSRPEPYLVQLLNQFEATEFDGQTPQNLQDLRDYIDARLPAGLAEPERGRTVAQVIDKSGGTFLYLRLVEQDRALDFSRPAELPDKLDGYLKAAFNRYYPDIDAYVQWAEPFLRLLTAAPGPLPRDMARQVLQSSQGDLTRKVIEPLGSLLQQRDGGLTFYHASLADWLKDPARSGGHCVNDTGAAELARFVWQEFEAFEASGWKTQVVDWLATLVRHTAQWDVAQALGRVAAFLREHRRHRDAIEVLRRQLTLIGRTKGDVSEDAGDCVRALGDALELLGDSQGALLQFKKCLTIAERMTARDPDNAEWQRGLGLSYMRIGGVLKSQGNLTGALEAFKRCLAIAEDLAMQDPDHAGWQRELGASYDSIGRVLQSQGNLAGALEAFKTYLGIAERLGTQDPSNVGWQWDLGVGHNRLGGVLESQGDLAGALNSFRQNLHIFERLAAQDPENAGWQRELHVGYSRIGAVLKSQGNLAGALEAFKTESVISERLAALDPDNARWQEGLGVSYNLIGAILASQGNLDGALEHCKKHLAIFERLVAMDPYNAGWHRGLGGSYNRIGAVLESQGNLDGALEQFKKHLAISERLAALDPDNAGWQRDLGVSYSRIGAVLESQGNLDGALEQFKKHLAISERLAALDPDNAGWQRGLGVSYNRIGAVLESQGKLDEALEQFKKYLAISERLAALDPDYAEWQRDVAISHARQGDIELLQGIRSAAQPRFLRAESIFAKLRDPASPGTLIDHAGVLARLAANHTAMGQHDEAHKLDLQIAETDWTPDAVSGAFRKKSVPKILSRLDAVFDRCDPELRARVAIRCLSASGLTNASELKHEWRMRAEFAITSLPPDHPLTGELAALLAPTQAPDA